MSRRERRSKNARPVARPALLGVSLLAALTSLFGCAVLTIDVDVYKGPLANEEQTQVEQITALAMGAKPLLIELRDQLATNNDREVLDVWRTSGNHRDDCADKPAGLNLIQWRNLCSLPREYTPRSISRRAAREGTDDRLDDEYAHKIDLVLGLYEDNDSISSSIRRVESSAQNMAAALRRAIPDREIIRFKQRDWADRFEPAARPGGSAGVLALQVRQAFKVVYVPQNRDGEFIRDVKQFRESGKLTVAAIRDERQSAADAAIRDAERAFATARLGLWIADRQRDLAQAGDSADPSLMRFDPGHPRDDQDLNQLASDYLRFAQGRSEGEWKFSAEEMERAIETRRDRSDIQAGVEQERRNLETVRSSNSAVVVEQRVESELDRMLSTIANPGLRSRVRTLLAFDRSDTWYHTRVYAELADREVTEQIAVLAFPGQAELRAELVSEVVAASQAYLTSRDHLGDLFDGLADLTMHAEAGSELSEFAIKILLDLVFFRDLALMVHRHGDLSALGTPGLRESGRRRAAGQSGGGSSGLVIASERALLHERLRSDPERFARLLRRAHTYGMQDRDKPGARTTLNGIAFPDDAFITESLIDSISSYAADLAEKAPAFDGGRIDQGIESLTDDYLRDRQYNSDSGKMPSDEQLRLELGLVHFAEKLLTLANYGLLVQPESPRLLPRDTGQESYTNVLQAIGNTIITQINELRVRRAYHANAESDRAIESELDGFRQVAEVAQDPASALESFVADVKSDAAGFTAQRSGVIKQADALQKVKDRVAQLPVPLLGERSGAEDIVRAYYSGARLVYDGNGALERALLATVPAPTGESMKDRVATWLTAAIAAETDSTKKQRLGTLKSTTLDAAFGAATNKASAQNKSVDWDALRAELSDDDRSLLDSIALRADGLKPRLDDHAGPLRGREAFDLVSAAIKSLGEAADVNGARLSEFGRALTAALGDRNNTSKTLAELMAEAPFTTATGEAPYTATTKGLTLPSGLGVTDRLQAHAGAKVGDELKAAAEAWLGRAQALADPGRKALPKQTAGLRALSGYGGDADTPGFVERAVAYLGSKDLSRDERSELDRADVKAWSARAAEEAKKQKTPIEGLAAAIDADLKKLRSEAERLELKAKSLEDLASMLGSNTEELLRSAAQLDGIRRLILASTARLEALAKAAEALDAKDRPAEIRRALAELKTRADGLVLRGYDIPDRKQIESRIQVVESLISQLEYQLILEEAAGRDSGRVQDLRDALASAHTYRAGQIYLRPASFYLRNSTPASSLQLGNRMGYRNMLTQQGLLWTPFVGADWRRNDETRSHPFYSSSHTLQNQAEIDKVFWQNINRVRVAGGGDTSYAIAKDDIGNWYVKSYSNNVDSVINSGKNLALFGLAQGGGGAGLLQGLRAQAENGEAPVESNASRIADHLEDGYVKGRIEAFNDVATTAGGVLDELEREWIAISDAQVPDDAVRAKLIQARATLVTQLRSREEAALTRVAGTKITDVPGAVETRRAAIDRGETPSIDAEADPVGAVQALVKAYRSAVELVDVNFALSDDEDLRSVSKRFRDQAKSVIANKAAAHLSEIGREINAYTRSIEAFDATSDGG